MHKSAGFVLIFSLSITSAPSAEIALSERLRQALAGWPVAGSDDQRADLERTLGPFNDASLREISAAGEELQHGGKLPESLVDFEFCSWYARRSNNYLQASVCLQLSGVTERLMGRYVESEAHYKESLLWAHHPGATQRIPFVTNNLAGLYGAQSRYGEAIERLDEVVRMNERNGIKNDAAPIQNLAIVYSLQGDMARALSQFLIALRVYEQQGDERKIALTHYNIGVLQMKQSNYEAAAGEIETAIRIQGKTGDKVHATQALSDLGRLRDLQGRPKEALELMTRGADTAKEIGFRSGYGEALANLGDFHQAHKEWEAAAANYTEARQVFTELHDSNDLAMTLRGLGLVAMRRNQPAAAADYALLALEESRRIGDMQGEWQAQALTGMAARAGGDRPKARAAFERAIQLVERQRGMVAGGDLEKQRFFEEAVYPYRELALLTADEGGFPALQAVERTRGRVLVDVLESGPDRIEQFLTSDEREKDRRFRASMSGLNARISNGGAGQAAVLKERDELWNSYQAFLSGAYVRHPALRNWSDSPAALSESDVAELVRAKDTVAIEYLCTADQTLMFLISRGADAAHPKVQIERIGIGKEELSRRTERFSSLLQARDPGFQKEAQSLYKLLLGPLRSHGLSTATRVWVIPDGPLWEMPFQALVAPSGKYWIENAEISFAPSLTFVRDKAKSMPVESTFTKDLIAFGDPARPDVPGTAGLRDQVRRIAALYDPSRTEVRVGPSASEKEFRKDAPSGRVIHVAAHGMVDQQNPLHSRILLAGTSSEDGWIEAWELMRMGLTSDLVVLSACETGRGRVAAGEGLVGLTWALFVSGVRNAVVSQWRVEAESASALMVGMHRRLQAGQRPSAALRGSALEVMKDERFRHPMYWAAFVSSGVDAPFAK